MKKLKLFLVLQVALLTTLVNKVVAQASDSIAFTDIPGVNEIPASWAVVLGGIVIAYEVVIRIVPTVKSYSIVGRLVTFIDKLSKFLDNKKK